MHPWLKAFAAPGEACPVREILYVASGTAIAIAVIGALPALWLGRAGDSVWLIGPMGASALLMLAFPDSPGAKTYAVVIGNLLAALLAIAWTHSGLPTSLVAGLAAGSAVIAMAVFRAFHPPSAGLALTVALCGPHSLSEATGFLMASVLAGSFLLVAVAWGWARLRRTWARRDTREPMTSRHDCRDLGDSVR